MIDVETRLVDRLPGIDFYATSLGDANSPVISIEIRITSWRRFLWYYATTRLDIEWWQWPCVLIIIARIVLLARLGRWQPQFISKNISSTDV